VSDIEITFDEKLSKAIENAIKKNPSRVIETLWKSAYLIESKAKVNAQANFEHPTGNLPSSLHSEVDIHAFSAEIGTNLEYARLREFGGVVRNAWGRGIVAIHIGRPYLTKALESEKNEVIEKFRKLCDDIVNDISREAK
jgi:phage gpG-like protein